MDTTADYLNEQKEKLESFLIDFDFDFNEGLIFPKYYIDKIRTTAKKIIDLTNDPLIRTM